MSGVGAKRSLDPGSVGSGAASVSDTPEASPPRGGALMLVVGPSASGKDTLLEAARLHFRDDARLLFSRRVITRTDQTGEPHEIVSEHVFRRIAEEGGFFLAWEAHGLHYGISAGVLDALTRGRSVIINVSRQIIPDARGRWSNTHVISVRASEEVRRRRLLARGRESAGDVDERLRRAVTCDLPEANWVTSIDNSGDLGSGVVRFISAIDSVLEQASDRADFAASRP
jgi:ribose 1,5-bisphosphokinase